MITIHIAFNKNLCTDFLKSACIFYQISKGLSSTFFRFFSFFSRRPTEKEGFEPSRRSRDLLPFQGSPFSHLGTSPRELTICCRLPTERRERDSNPRALADKRFSRPPRYDHFDISPYSFLFLIAHQRRILVYHLLLLLSTLFFIFFYFFIIFSTIRISSGVVTFIFVYSPTIMRTFISENFSTTIESSVTK